MTNKQQIEFPIKHADTRIADYAKQVADKIESLAREAGDAKHSFEAGRSVECFASNCAMRAMELAQLAARLEQEKSLRNQMGNMLGMISG